MSDSLGAILKEARRRRGLRVKDLAKQTKAEISPSYLSCIENDLRLPSEDLLLELAELLSLDGRSLYIQLVQQRAPESIRATLFSQEPAKPSNYEALRGLTLEEILDQAAQSVQARRDAQEARREVSRVRRGVDVDASVDAFESRWLADASRYRMLIEKNVAELSLSINGDSTIDLHTIGLAPQPGKPPIVALQHRATLNSDAVDDEGFFKMLESPDDVPIEIQRIPQNDQTALVRLLFPDGLSHVEHVDRRLTYVVRSVMRGTYVMEVPKESHDRVGDVLRDHRGPRGRFFTHIDKPCRNLELSVRFPRYYIPDEVEAWAGTQLPSDTDDNFIDCGVCRGWKLDVGVDYRVTLKIEQPLLGMRYAIVWRPMSTAAYTAVRDRLSMEDDEPVLIARPAIQIPKKKTKRIPT